MRLTGLEQKRRVEGDGLNDISWTRPMWRHRTIVAESFEALWHPFEAPFEGTADAKGTSA
jgi:hypothetical protein